MTDKLDVTKCNERFGANNFKINKLSEGIYEVSIQKPSQVGTKDSPHFSRIDAESSGDGNTVELSFSSETPVMRWGEPEILSHDKEDCDFSRLAEVGAILKNHNPDCIVGSPENVRLDDGTRKGRCTLRFGTTDDAKKCKHEVLVDKTLRGVSVGYVVNSWVYLQNENVTYKGRFVGPAWIAAKWQAIEASLTPIPADGSVGVNRTLQDASKQESTTTSVESEAARAADATAENAAGTPAKKEQGMTDKIKEEAARSQAAEVAAPPAGMKPDELKAERVRVKEIRNICAKHGLNERVDEFIENGTSVDAVRKLALDAIAEKNPSGQPVVVRDGAESFRSAAIDGLRLQDGQKIDKPAVGADEFRGMGLRRLAEECLRRAGKVVPSDVREMVSLALRGSETITGSSSDFPYILANTANKSLLDGYAVAAVSYPFWALVGSLNDFKAATRVKFSEVGKLKLVPENGKYAETAMTEKRETIQLGTYGRVWTMSRQAIINDDLGAFTRVPFSFGMQAAQLPNDLAIAVLNTNANLTDGAALFSTTHGNYDQETDRRLDTVAHAQAAAVYMYGLFAAKQSFNAAAEADGKRYLNLRPRVWLVAMTDEIIARQAVVSAGDANATTKDIVNPLATLSLQVVPDQNIKTSSTDYKHFMFADPRLAPVVEVAFLQGNRAPYFERMDQTDTDGSKWLIRLDCGAAAVDHVGAVECVGTDA